MELFAFNTLLERGVFIGVVKTPLCAIIRGCFRFKITIQQPTLAQLYTMSALIKQMGLTSEELLKINLIDGYNIANNNAYKACEVLAVICKTNNYLLNQQHIASILYRSLTAKQFEKAWQLALLHSGVANFTNTIRYINQKLMYLSPRIKGSQHTQQ